MCYTASHIVTVIAISYTLLLVIILTKKKKKKKRQIEESHISNTYIVRQQSLASSTRPTT